MSRAEITSLTNLVDASAGGGYTLPPELTDAYRIYRRVKAIEVPEPNPLHLDTAAARLVSAVAGGKSVDVLELGAAVAQAETDRRATELARAVLADAIEQAGNAATSVASGLTEQVISAHLRPALDEVYARVREVSAQLDGYGLDDPHRLVTAPAKVRTAYGALPALVARVTAILTARKYANFIGHREPQHDANNLFADYRQPLALSPQWKPPAQIPRIPAPHDPTERLLWTVSEAAAPAQPWLPTMAEQDAAWWNQFGEGVENRAQRHRDAQAIGARIGA